MILFETTVARGLKLWLQVGLGAPIATPWTEIQIREILFFKNPDFSFFGVDGLPLTSGLTPEGP